MQKRNKSKKIQNIVVLAGLSAVVLIVSTFAWFIGRQEVGVNSFNVKVSAIEHLELSLNGVAWSDTIDIENGTWAAFDATDASTVYDGHTNSWGTGLVPVSSAGIVNTAASRLSLFEKSSFTRTAGGFKVLSEAIDNNTVTTAATAATDATTNGTPAVIVNENEGYVAFDLFVKNSSGTQYFEAYNPTQEEEIFLTYNSAAVVDASASAEQIAAGVENSIRVAFLQVGRVAGTTTEQDAITGIDCAGTQIVDGINVTAICQGNRNTIWEPNDVAHNTAAVTWFADNCSQRNASATDLLNAASYSVGTACTTYEDGTYYATNSIHTAIPAGSAVDIYDGLNSQTADTTYTSAYNTFTDTEKVAEGDARNPFMFLAPNSITKLRVYIYIEGMDLDNMDLAEVLGTEVTVNFGFTKQQYETSTDHNGTLDNGYDTVTTP